MKLYKIDDYKELIHGCDYWLRFNSGPWLPCVVIMELVGLEIRMEIRGGRFERIAFWPEDPTMRELLYDEITLLGPMEQPNF